MFSILVRFSVSLQTAYLIRHCWQQLAHIVTGWQGAFYKDEKATKNVFSFGHLHICTNLTWIKLYFYFLKYSTTRLHPGMCWAFQVAPLWASGRATSILILHPSEGLLKVVTKCSSICNTRQVHLLPLCNVCTGFSSPPHCYIYIAH